MAIIQGTKGSDNLFGTPEDDVIYALAGDDYGGAGAGNDTVRSGDGNDEFYGDDGKDIVYGGNGKDKLDGGDGQDTLHGNSDNDTLNGFFGNDSLRGGRGNDLLVGCPDFNRQDFSGVIPGEIDTLNGGVGRDTFVALYTYDDNNPLTAGTTDYVLIQDFNPNQDFIQLTGSKTNYFLAPSPDGLPRGTAIFVDKPTNAQDEIIAIVENASSLSLSASYFTTTVDDIYNGTNGVDRFYGGEGDDMLNGKDGDDILYGGNGNDTLRGLNGNDSLYGGDGDDIFQSADVLVGENGSGEIDTFTGGAGIDKFILGDSILISPKASALEAVYYSAADTTDYALIQDFNSDQDFIQLLGTADNYVLSPLSNDLLIVGTGIYFNNYNNNLIELIAVMQEVSPSSLSLTASCFSYVS